MSVRRELLRMVRFDGFLDALGDMLPLTHYSADRHVIIDPEKAMLSRRGARGTEKQLIAAGDYPPQTYWGVNVGRPGGYRPENGVGWNRHEVLLPRERFVDMSEGGFRRAVADMEQYLRDTEGQGGKFRMSDDYWRDRAVNKATAGFFDEGYYGLFEPERSIAVIGRPVVPEVVHGRMGDHWGPQTPFDWLEYLSR